VDGRRALLAASVAQLAAGAVGAVVAVRRRRPYDMWLPAGLGLRGRPGRVGTDVLWIGTALSPPTPMAAVQAWAVVRLGRRPDPGAARVLGLLGALMTPGILLERSTRELPRRRDPVETPVVAASLGLAAAMAGLGLGGSGRARAGTAGG
jgi:hypothetical protein